MSVWGDRDTSVTVEELMRGRDSGRAWLIRARFDVPYVTAVEVSVSELGPHLLPRRAVGAQAVREIEVPRGDAPQLAAAVRAMIERARAVARALDAAGELENDGDLDAVLARGSFAEEDVPRLHPQAQATPEAVMLSDGAVGEAHDGEVSGPVHAWQPVLAVLDAA